MAHVVSRLAATAAVALSLAPALADTEGMTRVATVAVGSSFQRAVRDTGSYGSGTSTPKSTRMPNREWMGRTVAVWRGDSGAELLLDPKTGAFVAFLNPSGQPTTSFEPAYGWPWPLKVGKSWTTNTTMTIHATANKVPIEARSVVEAYEDVATPAGTFKAWRVRTEDNQGNVDVNWFSTDLTVFVKQKLTRSERSGAGAGTRETELLSQAIRHD